MSKDKDLDDLFKRKIGDPVDEPAYNEADWDALEQMLDKGKKRRGVIYRLPIYGSVAALLLLVLGYWAFRQKDTGTTHPIKQQAIANQQPVHSGINSTATKSSSNGSVTTPGPAAIAKDIHHRKPGGLNNQPGFAAPVVAGHPITSQDNLAVENGAIVRENEPLSSAAPQTVFGAQRLEAPELAIVKLKGPAAITAAGTRKGFTASRQQPAYRPQFALNAIAAPDFNGVGSFAQAKVGTNEGLLVNGGISRRFFISTGVIYSSKPYLEGFESYHSTYQFPVNPVNVTADCRMLDIPVNLNYLVYKKSVNSFSVGTGLSSYIMLHESYKFNYAAGGYYQTGPAQYTVPGTDSYYFGVLNLNATYQRQLNSKFGLSVQPYVKLPLTNIGYSQVKLQTTGVALGLTWNLNSSSKP